jgi:hypothetical protein
MTANKENKLEVTASDGTPIAVRWPSCGAPVLGHLVDFCNGKKRQTFGIDGLFAVLLPADHLIWGGKPGEFKLSGGHILSASEMEKIEKWLETREVPKVAVAMPAI